MHRELLSIVQLWQHDCEVDQLRDQAAALKERVVQLEQTIKSLAADIERVEEQRLAYVAKQSEFQRELDRYITRRDRAKELMKGGHSLDFGTVQKQVEQCSEKVDDLELEVLQMMENRDQCVRQIEEKTAEKTSAEASRDQANEEWRVRGGEIRVAMERVWPVRQMAANELTRDQRVRYEDFRKRGITPIAPISDDICGECHVVIARHMCMEVVSGKRLHTCRGCRRWLVAPKDEDELDENSPDA